MIRICRSENVHACSTCGAQTPDGFVEIQAPNPAYADEHRAAENGA